MKQSEFKRMFEEIDSGFPVATTARLHGISEATLRRWNNMGYEKALEYKFIKCKTCNTTTFRDSHNHTYCEYCCNIQPPKLTKKEKKEAKLQEIRAKIKDYFNSDNFS